MIIPYLRSLIDYNTTIENNSNKWKIQINMSVNCISSNDTGEILTISVWSDTEEIWSGNRTTKIIRRLLKSFLTNY